MQRRLGNFHHRRATIGRLVFDRRDARRIEVRKLQDHVYFQERIANLAEVQRFLQQIRPFIHRITRREIRVGFDLNGAKQSLLKNGSNLIFNLL